MAHGDTFSTPQEPGDDAQFDRLRADLRALPKLKTSDDFLARVRQEVDATRRPQSAPEAPQRPVLWDWMRGRLAFLSTIAGVAIVVVVAITLTRNPELQEVVPVGPVPELRQAPEPDAVPAPQQTPAITPRRDAGNVEHTTPIDLLEQPRSGQHTPASESPTISGEKSKEAERQMDEKRGSDAPAGNTLPAGLRANEKGDAARKAEDKDVPGASKAVPTYEQDYDPIQKKELVKMRTGLTPRDSAALRDSLKLLQAKPK